MVFLVLDLLPLLGDAGVFFFPRELASLHPLAQFPQTVLLLLPQVRVLLDLGLVEPVDNDVFPLRDEDTFNLSR